MRSKDAYDAEQKVFLNSQPDIDILDDSPKLPSSWQALGPFPRGSREQGADPLSAYGGFENLPFSETDQYPSELADGGYVKWQTVRTNSDQSVGPVVYNNVRWDFNQDPFGWTSLHHSIYLRGNFTVSRGGVYRVSFNGVTSFKIDDRAYVGNIYEYTHESSSSILLSEGEHALYICLDMDVRRLGGTVPPKPRFYGLFTPVDLSAEHRGIVLIPEDAVMPEVIGDKLVTPYASVTLLNANVTGQDIVPTGPRATDSQGPRGDESGWIQVVRARGSSPTGEKIDIILPVHFSIKLAPGQIYPVPLNISIEGDKAPQKIKIELDIADLGNTLRWTINVGEYELARRQWGSVYKITFLDYDRSVHFAMALPPKNTCEQYPEKRCPVILALHGAGVEASSSYWTDSYRQQDSAWNSMVSAVISAFEERLTDQHLRGYDWHGPSYWNIETALDALRMRPGVPDNLLQSVGVNRERQIYAGHSNGGQGAWWLLSHYPDKALAGLPAAGYIKIQFYIPYFMRIGDAYADPLLRGILESAIAEHDIDLYSSNMAGIPILARTGGSDDNVPPLHSRRLIRMVNEWSRRTNAANLSEIPNQGHWFSGVVDDEIMQSFLDTSIQKASAQGLELPPLPTAFSLSTLNPASTGSKGGIRILQLEVPFRLGTIRVHQNGDQWVLNTTNVRRFGFVADSRQDGLKRWSVDGTNFEKPPSVSGKSYLLGDDGVWKIADDMLWISEERHFSTYGPAIHIFDQPFIIVIPSTNSTRMVNYRKIAQHLSTSWYLFGRGGTQIVRDVDVLDGIAAQYNMLVLGGPEDNLFTKKRQPGIESMVKFTASGGFEIGTRKYEDPGTGILFLAPSPTRTRMGLFIAGTDEDGLLRAAWTVPFRTGLQVPDYIVLGEEYGDPSTGWTAGDGAPFGGAGTKGAGGVLAAGYWSNKWDFDARCGYLK
ncbi:hypothetical protein HDV00_004796 [Rhizophlyctis rosea]|nr:hypothetical protein HDV00_004796 [Rhizophlyctis rosea]